MENVKLIKVSTGDYEVLYENGCLILENHRLNLDEVLGYLMNKVIDSYESYYIDDDVIEEKYSWSFPAEFDEFDKEDLD